MTTAHEPQATADLPAVTQAYWADRRVYLAAASAPELEPEPEASL